MSYWCQRYYLAEELKKRFRFILKKKGILLELIVVSKITMIGFLFNGSLLLIAFEIRNILNTSNKFDVLEEGLMR